MKKKIEDARDVYEREGAIRLAIESTTFAVDIVQKRVYWALFQVLGLVVEMLDRIVPNDSQTVLFSTAPGRMYKGNCRHVYEYILENKPDLNPVWIAHERSVYDDLSKRGYPVARAASLRGLYLLLRAEVYVAIHMRGLSIHQSLVPDSVTVIRTGHGDGVMGELHRSDENVARRRAELERYYDYWLTTSEFARDFRMKNFDTDNDVDALVDRINLSFGITGYPRNDRLIEVPDAAKDDWDKFVPSPEPSTVLLYAPSKHYLIDVDDTDPAVDFFPFEDFNRDSLYSLLEDEDMLLLLRPHPGDIEKMNARKEGPYKRMQDSLQQLCADSDRVRMATQFEFPDTTKLLPFVDVLITDYSSIYHDYLLLDRPILFIPYDFESYEEQRGFVYDYKKYLSGPEVTSFDQFQNEVDAMCAGRDGYVKKRRVLRDKIHMYTDAGSRKRVANLVSECLKS